MRLGKGRGLSTKIKKSPLLERNYSKAEILGTRIELWITCIILLKEKS